MKLSRVWSLPRKCWPGPVSGDGRHGLGILAQVDAVEEAGELAAQVMVDDASSRRR